MQPILQLPGNEVVSFEKSGSYTIKGSEVTVKINLIRNEQLAATTTLVGTITTQQSKIDLVKKLVVAIGAEAQKLLVKDNR